MGIAGSGLTVTRDRHKIVTTHEYMFMYRYVMEEISEKIDLDDETAEHLAALFSTLGDPGRVRILAALLEQDLNVGELAERVGLSHSAVSHHLRHLRQMRLVRAQKQGRYVYYALDDEHVRDLFAHGLAHVQHR